MLDKLNKNYPRKCEKPSRCAYLDWEKMPDLVSIQFGTDIDEIKLNRGFPPKRYCEKLLKSCYNVIRCGGRSCNDKI